MALNLNTFVNIFGTDFGKDPKNPLKLEKIVIPKIQRDYAQGRITSEISRIRAKFLDALYNAITEKPITLDFVYGDIDSNGVMTPLDGQQRLTTLFLLHWYACKKFQSVNPNNQDDFSFLKKFSYETRYSARDFCENLVKFMPSFSEKLKLSEDIINQSWFPLSWKNDPTISAMLVMIDDINEKFRDVNDLWQKLKSKAVSFYFLPLKELSLTDELYIKMNSRGKPLTRFEHFKAELEHELRKFNIKLAERIIRKIDIDWTDMLWDCSNKEGAIDTAFLNYFRFICDIICYKQGDTPQSHKNDNDEFSLFARYFSTNSNNLTDNLDLMEKAFDCWCKLSKSETIDKFFADRVAAEVHEKGKIIADSEVNYFKNCLNGYLDSYGDRNFSLGEVCILYAFVTHLINTDDISDEQFRRRLRVIRNLVNNSEDELSDSTERVGGNRMPTILKQIDSIIIEGNIREDIGVNFNVYQLKEEKLKLTWTAENPNLAESLYEFEDHFLLYGQIDIVGLDHIDYFSRFISLFNCTWDLIDRALMAIGNYIQKERNGWRYQSGSSKYPSAWQELFHHSSNNGFENTKNILQKLLSKYKIFNDDRLTKMADDYIAFCESKSLFDWRYYYIKYDEFRPGRYGKYWWDNFEKEPYNFTALWTEKNPSENAYQPFLKIVEKDNNISRPHCGSRLIFDNNYLECENSAYVFRDNETNNETARLDIKQNPQGIDIEDRIQKYLKLY